MYETIPSRSNKKSQYISILLLIGAFAVMLFSAIPDLPFHSVIQFMSLALLTVSIFMMTRYILCSYSYAVIHADDGKLDLTVSEIKRKSRITVCRIGLVGIESVTLVKSTDKELSENLKANGKGRKSFNYCIDLAPAQYIHILAEECGQRIVLKLSYDEKLFSILSDASLRNSSESTES